MMLAVLARWRVSCSMHTGRDRDPAVIVFAPFGGWHEGSAGCYDARSYRRCASGHPALLTPIKHKGSYVLCRPIAGTRSAGPPATGSRRLPPAPPPHPAARFTKHNWALCSIGRIICHAHCCSRPRIRRGSARASLAGSLHAIRRTSLTDSV